MNNPIDNRPTCLKNIPAGFYMICFSDLGNGLVRVNEIGDIYQCDPLTKKDTSKEPLSREDWNPFFKESGVAWLLKD